MERPENNKWLDEALTETIGSEKPRTDFDKWKQQHPDAVKMLTSRAHRQVVSPGSLTTRRIIMSSRNRIWKVAVVLAVLIGAGAIATAVGLKIRKYYFAGRETDGTYNTYKFTSELETVELEDGSTEVRGSMVGITSMDPNFTIDVDQKIKDLEEIDLLRQQDDRELIRVTEKEVDGKPQPRTFGFKYVLSDGREETIGESDPDTQDRERSLTEEQQEELLNLRLQRAGKEEYLSIEKKEVSGRVFIFKQQRYILSDGTEVMVSVGRLKDDWW